MWFTRPTVTSFPTSLTLNFLRHVERKSYPTVGIRYAFNSANKPIRNNIRPDLKPGSPRARKPGPARERISPQQHAKNMKLAKKNESALKNENTIQKTSKENVVVPIAKKKEVLRVEFTEAKPGKKLSELADTIFTKNPYFVHSAVKHTEFKLKTLPEVAFVGRSNVGKSSIINALANRNRLVKTSKTPGHTKLLNTFSMADKLVLVDMPGYGFRSWDEWGTMSMDYFRESTRLRRIFVLIEATHSFKEKDRDLMSLLDGMGVSYQVVLTKIDKLSSSALAEIRSEIETELSQNTISCFPQVLPISTTKKVGITELRCAILEACRINS
ncbi:hypothetical protein K7432_006157 [Basidiobolus ranarum]|uniref:GTP-binding protein 8 n=1 Tax=Basidiobolus ranarum TaxID=34480 RepID=A0ABR2W213_9FUNG